MDIIVTLVIGAVAGWLGAFIFKGSGLGLLWNIVIGILGGFVGSWLFGKLGINNIVGENWANSIITGAAGAIVILAVINLVAKLSKK